MEARPKSLHLCLDGLITPAPAADHHQVRSVSHHRPAFEQRAQVLARLDRADEEDEPLRQLQTRPSLGQVLGAERMEGR